MTNANKDKALVNELASIKREGYIFSDKEIANVLQCLDGEITFQQFTDKIKQDIRTA